MAADLPPFETMSLVGEWDVLRAPELRERLLALLETGRPVVVDLSSATFLDSSSLGVFVSAFKQARQRQPLLFLVPREPRSNIRRVFEISGLARVLPLLSSWQEVEQSLGTGEPAPASQQSQ
jgi:anti-sigma B factor antagonist